MTLEHAAIRTSRLELLKDFYVRHFDAVANAKYVNPAKGFESYFQNFAGGTRLEIMSMPGIPVNLNDTVQAQHLALIHPAFRINTMGEVDTKAQDLAAAGFTILSGPRKTGDGYYEFETLNPDGNRLELTAVRQ